MNNQLNKWTSGNVTVARSNSHQDMYIIEHGNGFHNLTASYDYMIAKYPPNQRGRSNGPKIKPVPRSGGIVGTKATITSHEERNTVHIWN